MSEQPDAPAPQDGEPVDGPMPETDNSPRPEDGDQDVDQTDEPVDGSETVEG